MTEVVETYFRNLLNLQGWKIYYTNTDKGVLSTAFCYENDDGVIFITRAEIMNLTR